MDLKYSVFTFLSLIVCALEMCLNIYAKMFRAAVKREPLYRRHKHIILQKTVVRQSVRTELEELQERTI